MRQQPVDHRSEPAFGVVVLVRDGLVAHVAARHHQRAAHTTQQQMMKRRVREHHTQLREPGATSSTIELPVRRGATTIGWRVDASAVSSMTAT